jgi:hypothetical protein
MKNILIAFMAMACLTASAQKGRIREKLEQVRSLKVSFITTELSLTPDESAKFWPIYNAFEEKQKEIRKQKVSAYLDRQDSGAIDKLSEKEAAGILSQMESNDEQLYLLRKKLIADLRNVLPAKKILKLKKAEEDFNKKLLQQYRSKRK